MPRRIAACAFRRWPAPTKGFCSAWPTPRALRAKELDDPVVGPAQNPEFVLLHGDNVDASGFVQHIKLPHYVDFQADLSLIRGLRAKRQNDKDI